MDTISIGHYLGGGQSLAFIYAALLWAGVGVALWKYIHYLRRDKGGIRYQIDFDLVYFVEDNVIPLLGNLLFTIAFIRFTADFVAYLNVEFLHFGQDPMFIYILFGFTQQILIDFLKKKVRKNVN